MIKVILSPLLLILLVNSSGYSQNNGDAFSWQGHRGARGLFPENSIEGFLLAMDINKVNTLELDLVVTADRQLLISHEPWMNRDICKGEELGEEANIFDMSFQETLSYDCGQKQHPDFPEQNNFETQKPLFETLLKALLQKAEEQNTALPYLNVELKSRASWYGTYCPEPKEYVLLLIDLLDRSTYPKEKICIQSFDKNILIAYNAADKNQRLSFLVSFKTSLRKTRKVLGFTPDVLSPRYTTLNKRIVKDYHSAGVRIIPWTVNDAEQMKKLINMGVDGIISDYPNLYEKVNY